MAKIQIQNVNCTTVVMMTNKPTYHTSLLSAPTSTASTSTQTVKRVSGKKNELTVVITLMAIKIATTG